MSLKMVIDQQRGVDEVAGTAGGDDVDLVGLAAVVRKSDAMPVLKTAPPKPDIGRQQPSLAVLLFEAKIVHRIARKLQKATPQALADRLTPFDPAAPSSLVSKLLEAPSSAMIWYHFLPSARLLSKTFW